MHTSICRCVAATLLASALLAPAVCRPAHAGDVWMFERPPTVEEVQELLTAPARRTRGIEIVGGAVKTAQHSLPAVKASYSPASEAPKQVAAQPQQPPVQQQVAALPSQQVATAPIREPSQEDADKAAFGFRINFAFNSSVIPADAFQYLDTVGQVLRAEPGVAIMIEGHTDAVGSDGYNMKLSEQRARAVESYLVTKYQVQPDRIRSVGKGKTEPLMSNPFDALNRRVQFARGN